MRFVGRLRRSRHSAGCVGSATRRDEPDHDEAVKEISGVSSATAVVHTEPTSGTGDSAAATPRCADSSSRTSHEPRRPGAASGLRCCCRQTQARTPIYGAPIIRNILVVIMCVAAGGCGWLRPDDDEDAPRRVTDNIDGMRGTCLGEPGGVRHAATTADPLGGSGWQLWVAEGDPVGIYVIAPVDDDVGSVAWSGCLHRSESDDALSFVGMGNPDGVALYAGRVPADVVEIRLDSGAPLAVDGDGIFLVATEGDLEQRPQIIDAFDDDGELVASTTG